jgi:hypothetical protein
MQQYHWLVITGLRIKEKCDSQRAWCREDKH